MDDGSTTTTNHADDLISSSNQGHGRGRGRGRGRGHSRGNGYSRWPRDNPRLESQQVDYSTTENPDHCYYPNAQRTNDYTRGPRGTRNQRHMRPRIDESHILVEMPQQPNDLAQTQASNPPHLFRERYHRRQPRRGNTIHPNNNRNTRDATRNYGRRRPDPRPQDENEASREGSHSNRDNNLEEAEMARDTVSDVQKEIAENQFKSNDFECMICCDNIRRHNPIWCCGNCYNIFHLKCAVEWCNKSIKSRNEAISNAQYPTLSTPMVETSNLAGQSQAGFSDGFSDYQTERMRSVEWPCPTCREIQSEKPNKYKCFCGKVVRPDVNKTLTPHSCGQLCGRPRPTTDCPHTCNTICHPGRCAPCLLTSRRACFCGKSISDVKCSIGTKSCEQICGKILGCGKHYCDKMCHDGPCKQCDEKLMLSCNCGLEKVEKLCRELNKDGRDLQFSCDKICGKPLKCGKHYCKEKCHPGPDCKSCPLLSSNIRTCPCGSTSIKKSLLIERKSCTDPIPTCANNCHATLICGPEKNRHRCPRKCHTGPCPPCKLKSPVLCECKLTTKTVECASMFKRITKDDGSVYFEQESIKFFCEMRCNKPKNCGRHRCNNKCCPARIFGGPLHACEQKCNKKLPCGQHTCPETCHPGQCGDCTNIGWEELTCHCGMSVLYPPIPCGARPPVCYRPCRRDHSCDHPVKHECHDESEKCAPCTVFVKKSCFCGHESKDNVYCYQSGYSCGKTCKKRLACGQHTCKRVCHDGECETKTKQGVILCNQPCPITRYLCKHACGLTCHGNTPCPPSECRKQLEVTCECGNKKEKLECYKLMRDVDNRNKVAMLSTNRTNPDSIMIDLSTKPAPKSNTEDADQLKQLDCDDTCSVLRRNKALAEALDIAQPDLKPVGVFGEDPLRLLREATVQDYKFVAATYNSLARFVASAKDSDKRFIFMQFPPTNKLRREVIHELAHHFNCTSESRDEEPFKHVVVRAYKNKSSVPDFNIEQLLPVTNE